LNRNELFKKMGTDDRFKMKYSELFMIRNNNGHFYISMRNGPYQVQGTPNFNEWIEAKKFLKINWRKLYDEEFERQVLIGSGEDTTNNDTEDHTAAESD
jgi:hypothetical protein